MNRLSTFTFSGNTAILPPGTLTSPVRHALEIFRRDFEKVFGRPAGTDTVAGNRETAIRVEYAGADDAISGSPEAFALRFSPAGQDGSPEVTLTGSDDLGLVYGLLHLSETWLGVDPFWFWTDKEPSRREAVSVPAADYISPEPRVRYRGWFVNDEVCLLGWKDVYPPPEEVWFPVFEALLRSRGNMVIPGTDLPRNGIHWELASAMGLRVTHHHAEPLGAEMFSRAYPDREPSYTLNGNLFEALWKEAIRRQKNRKVIWVLGFRGQGDCPFWEQDPGCATPQDRGGLISRVIRRQLELVRGSVPDPVCITYLYGEIAELYRAGHLEIPDGVIRIWSDNGYGRMVTRRQGNHNPRIPALPTGSGEGCHGLYYHVTFHDLQASSHLTMLGNHAGFVNEELIAAFASGADTFLLVNCGNIRPHVYLLDLVGKIWTEGRADVRKFERDFAARFYPSSRDEALECYNAYFECTIPYGPNQDDRAGEEFYHHPARGIMSLWLRGRTADCAEPLRWATGDIPFPEQVRWFLDAAETGRKSWEALRERCLRLHANLSGEERIFFQDNLLLQVTLHLSGTRGLEALCRSFEAFLEGDLPLAFVRATRAVRSYREGLDALSGAEHGKWRNFYRADWLTNIRATLYAAETLRRYLRVSGDGPDFFAWFKQYLMPDRERKIYLENTHRNPLPDDELADRLQAVLPGA